MKFVIEALRGSDSSLILGLLLVTGARFVLVVSLCINLQSESIKKEEMETLKNDEIDWNEKKAMLYNDIGLEKYKQVEFSEAIKYYTLSIKHHALPSAHYNRGVIKYRMGEFTAAAKDLEQALKIDPSFVEAKLGLAHIEKQMLDKIT